MRLISRILGWLLSGVGVFMILGFLFFQSHGGSARPFWMDALTILVVGVLPLSSGILLLRRRYDFLKTGMRLICGGCIAIFGLCSISHLLFPDIAASQLGVVAGETLIAAVISGAVWAMAWMRWRSRRQGETTV